MPSVTLAHALLAALAVALLVAAFTDLKSRRIGNRLNAVIALAAPAFWWACGLALWPDIALQLGVALACFGICTALFAIGAMGGGDVKLLTALALWIAPGLFFKMVVLMALLGGLLAVVLGAWKIARRKGDKLTIPYGVAIALAALWVIGVDYLPAQGDAGILG